MEITLPEYSNKIDFVKYIVAVLYQDDGTFNQVLDLLAEEFSNIDYVGQSFPFTDSDYYEAEMGTQLKRKVISFEKLESPGNLVSAKQTTRKIEERLSVNLGRTVNLDIGYLDMFKVILASYKGRSNKVYMSDNIWSDFVLYFEKGAYQSFVWSFPDFKSGKYNADLMEIRTLYKKQLKESR